MLNGGKPTQQDELQSVRDEFKRFREELAEKEKKQTEQQTQAQQQQQTQVIEDFKEEITQFLATNKDTYELSATREATEDIFSTINDAFIISTNEWHKNGRQGKPPAPMAIKEAAEIVESFYEKEVLRLTETTKLRQKLGIGQKPTEDPGQKARGPTPTLTNNMASTAASVVPAKNDADRMRRAMEKLG
jgi:vacuolar-type H+-ATPase subunit I/STV1